MKRNRYLLLVALLMMFSSCTIQKREYLKGFSVNWHSSKSKNEKQLKQIESADMDDSKKISNTESQESNLGETPATDSKIPELHPDSKFMASKNTEVNPLILAPIENHMITESKSITNTPVRFNEVVRKVDEHKRQQKRADDAEVLNIIMAIVVFVFGVLALISVIWGLAGIVGTIAGGLFWPMGSPAISALVLGLVAYLLGQIFDKKGADSGDFGVFLRLGRLFGLIGMIGGAVLLVLGLLFAAIF